MYSIVQFSKLVYLQTLRRRTRPTWCCWRWVSWVRRSTLLSSSVWIKIRARTWPLRAGSTRQAFLACTQQEVSYHCSEVDQVHPSRTLQRTSLVLDCRRGQSLVVHAINEGRQAAREVDLDLMGRTSLAGPGGIVRFDLTPVSCG